MRTEEFRFAAGDAIDALQPAWTAIQAAGGVQHPMYTWEWMSIWWEVFGEGRSMVALIQREGGKPVAIAPFVRRKAWMNRLFSFRRLELLGTGEEECDEVFSEYVDMPALPNAGGAAERLVEGVLALDGQDKWDDVVLHRVCPDSVACRTFRGRAAKAGLSVSQLPMGKCHFVVLPRCIEEYERQLSANRRQQVRRGMRALTRMGRVRFEKAETAEQALHFLDLLAEMHQERWTEKGKPGVFASTRFTRFHTAFIRRTFSRGWPELWVLRLDENPIAALYNIRHKGRISFYQSGLKLQDASDVRPGMLAHYLAIKAAIESGAKEYDFLLGESRYKTSLSNAARELVTVRISRRCAKEGLRRVVTHAGRRVRRILHRAHHGREE